jgi:AmmeMemoRadiSam system protein B
MATESKIRKPAVAGLFYSSHKNTLEKEVAVFLENAQTDMIINRLYGIVVPHAGYMYSGGVAARAYRQLLDRQFDTVVVISPSHHVYFEEISVFNGRGYSTPLGILDVDRDLAEFLVESHPNIIFSGLGHDEDEHALEVQLPFLQHVLNEFKIIPIVMGNQDKENIDILAEALSSVLRDQNVLVVASSDLSHYHKHDRAALLDKVVIDAVNNFDEEKLYADLQAGSCEMCGGGPVVTAMKVCRNLGARRSKVLLYRNSGDVTGDRSQVVGYMSGILYK